MFTDNHKNNKERIKSYEIPDDIDPTKFSRNLRITRKKFCPEGCVLIVAIVLKAKAI
jgi:hypothetical protein